MTFGTHRGTRLSGHLASCAKSLLGMPALVHAHRRSAAVSALALNENLSVPAISFHAICFKMLTLFHGKKEQKNSATLATAASIYGREPDQVMTGLHG